MRFLLVLSLFFFGGNYLFAQILLGFDGEQVTYSARQMHDNTRSDFENGEKNIYIDLRSGLDNKYSVAGSIVYYEQKGGTKNILSQEACLDSDFFIPELDNNYSLCVTDPDTGVRVFIKDMISDASGNVPVNTDYYFEASQPVEIGDKHYALFRATFPFSIEFSNTKIYSVKEISDCAILFEELYGMIDAEVPILIECLSISTPVNKNDLQKVALRSNGNKSDDFSKKRGNLIGSLIAQKKNTYQDFVQPTHREFSVSSSGNLVFTRPATSTLSANSAYVEVSPSAKESLAVFFDKREFDRFNESSYDGDAASRIEVYNLLGKKVNNSGNLPAGIYIIGGKKTVIR